MFAITATRITFVFFLLAILSIVDAQDSQRSRTTNLKGPKFVIEPPHRVVFSNSTGVVVNCNAVGVPAPQVTWIRRDHLDHLDIADGGSISSSSVSSPSSAWTLEASHLVHIRSDGSLLFAPFAPEAYRAEVHAARFVCLAANSGGTILSREVRMQAGKHKSSLLIIAGHTHISGGFTERNLRL